MARRSARTYGCCSFTLSVAAIPRGGTFEYQQATNVNGTTTQFAYDNALRLKEVWNTLAGGATLGRHTYTLDAAGNRTQVAETLAQVGGGTITPTTTYSYDRLYRLTGDGTNSYTYDPVGNRLSWGSTSYSYDRADRITAAGATSYTVNANGNLTSRGADSFAYDQTNRLKTATVGGTTTVYAWDGDGKRASSTTGGTTTSFVYDVGGKLPLLEDNARKYVYGQGSGPAYSADKSTGAVQVSHADALGSVRALTDGSGALVQTYRTDPFGVPTATQGSSAQPFGFTGEARDGETGLVYLRARMYDPQTGRFLQRDWVAKSAPGISGWNRYAYAANNPANLTDPSGHCLGPAIVICAFGVADWLLATGALATGTSLWMMQNQTGQHLVSAADAGGFGDPNQQKPRDPSTRDFYHPGGLIATVDPEGTMSLAVDRVAGGPSGAEMFDAAMARLGPEVKAIRTYWRTGSMSDNLESFNAGIQNLMSLEDAARQTWTGKMAARYGFTNVEIISTEGSVGNFTQVSVLFTP